jgi:hypothetical protein
MKLSNFWNVTPCSPIDISDKSTATIFRLEYRIARLHIVENGTLVSAFVSAVLITDKAGFSSENAMNVTKESSWLPFSVDTNSISASVRGQHIGDVSRP